MIYCGQSKWHKNELVFLRKKKRLRNRSIKRRLQKLNLFKERRRLKLRSAKINQRAHLTMYLLQLWVTLNAIPIMQELVWRWQLIKVKTMVIIPCNHRHWFPRHQPDHPISQVHLWRENSWPRIIIRTFIRSLLNQWV